jgi:hypothetical protein
MTHEPEQLERLISRYLDDEATRDEIRTLRRRIGEDASAAALFEECREIDREVRAALRSAVRPPRVISVRGRLLRAVGIAAAACVALLLWLTPNGHQPGQGRNNRHQAGLLGGNGASWFTPLPQAADRLEQDTQAYTWPQIRLKDTDRKWIVVPGDRPGEFLVIEVNEVRTHSIRVQREF